MDSPSKDNWFYLVLLGVIWGASFMGVTLALEDFGPLTVAAARISLAAITLISISWARGIGLPALTGENGSQIWIFAFVIALATNAVPFSLLSWAQQSVASGFAGVCMAVVPLFVLPLAHFLVPGERMHLRRVIGFCIGTIGVAVLIGPEAFAATGAKVETLARLACIAASLCYAIGSITTRLAPKIDTLAFAASILLLASLIMVPIALWVEGMPVKLGVTSFLAVLYLGILPTALAQLLIVKIVRSAGPTFLSLVNYQVPIWSVVFGSVLLSEPLPPSLFLALGLILTGLALSQLGALRRLFG